MTKTAASERNQFKIHQATHTSAASGRKRKKAKPGCGLEAGKARRARIEAPSKPKIAASAAAARRKLILISVENELAEAVATFAGMLLVASPLVWSGARADQALSRMLLRTAK